jgi:RimJ/RimL family protein N-acetyltransferase
VLPLISENVIGKKSRFVNSEPFNLHSERLLLREFTVDDAPQLFALYEDADVMRYTGEEPFTSVAAVEQFLSEYPYYERDGFGRWAVIDRRSDEFLGFCGLRRDNPTPEVDLGFRFFRRFWFQGYATEAARAALSTGFGAFGLTEIIGRTMRENLASTHVLKKLGLTFREVVEEDGLFWLIYSIDRETFARQPAPAVP